MKCNFLNIRLRHALLSAAFLFISNCISAQIIKTIAGNGTAGYSGDGGPATAAELNQPFGIKTDNAGNVYFSDFSGNRIRKISTTGVITTIAGGGSAVPGDGGPATNAMINTPVGVVQDATGNLYFSDLGNARIRKVTTSGIISTIAGTGVAGFSGDGGQATAAQVNYPNGMAIDVAGNLYFTEEANQRVRKISTTGIISTVAGSGPIGLGSGAYSGDGGPATAARLNRPYGVYADRHSNIFIADGWNNVVREVDASGNISTVAGGGSTSGVNIPATAAQLNVIIDVVTDTFGNLYISEGNGCRVLKVNTSGTLKLIAGNGTCGYSGDGGVDTAAEVNHPGGIALSACGNIFIADWANNRVREVTFCAPTFVNDIPAPGESTIQVYPNPSSGMFTVMLSSYTEEPVTITVINILGQKVKECSGLTNKATDIQVNQPGIYFIMASSLHENAEAKLIVR